MTERSDLIDRLKALEHRSREFERQSREEIQALQRQLDAALGRTAHMLECVAEPQGQTQISAARTGTQVRRPRKGQASGERLAGRTASANAAADTVEPARIPGVRIAYIGGRPEPIEGIRDYWEGRGAMFMHHEEERSRVPFDQVLARADVVFYPVDCIGPEAALRLQAFCDRMEKPLIPLHNAGMSGLHRALENWCPLA